MAVKVTRLTPLTFRMGLLEGLILRAPTNIEVSKFSSSPSLLGGIGEICVRRKSIRYSDIYLYYSVVGSCQVRLM